MTFREKLKQEHPERVDEYWIGGCMGCPYSYGYEHGIPDYCWIGRNCRACWDREMPETEPTDAPPASDLRPCEVNGQRCYFHRFIEEERGVLCFNITAPMATMEVQRVIDKFKTDGVVPCYCTLEKIRHAWALVELPDGQLKKVEPETVKFLDRRC